MLRKIKVGMFAFLFIACVTLSSIVAIVASTKADVDNDLYLTYEPSMGATLRSSFVNFFTEEGTILGDGEFLYPQAVIIDYETEGNLAIVANASAQVAVANDGSDDIMMYRVGDVIYILSSQTIIANSSSNRLFAYCDTIEYIEFNNFLTLGLTCTSEMFSSCYNLKTIYVTENWDLSLITEINATEMFMGCENLVGGNGTAYADARVEDHSYACIDTASTPGYFTLKTT